MKKTIVSALSLFAIVSVARAEDLTTYVHRAYPTKHATGLVRQPDSALFMAMAPHQSFARDLTPLPKSGSVRAKTGPIENQGQCGSCWDFSLTSTLRGTLKMKGKDPGRLSFNYLLNCATEMQGCNGGDFSAAAHFLAPKGAPAYGSDGAYTAVSGSCVAEPAVASAVSYKLLGNNGGEYPNAPAPSFRDIAYVIGVLHQPVSTDVAVDDNFESYGGGVYDGCSFNDEKDINHMVVIEGYDCGDSVDKNGNCEFDAHGNLPRGVGHWVVRNSWGADWGDDGYITMLATDPATGQRCNAIASDALYFHVKSAK